MRGSEFVFDDVHKLYYRFHTINSNCGRSYIDSPDWIGNKKGAIDPVIKKINAFNML